MVRLQKYLASCGVASRRGSEEIIRAGRVRVNGEIVTEMGIKIDEDYDTVTVDDVPIRTEKKMVYIMLNKPVGFVTTVSDDKGRDTVMDLVSDIPVRIYPVGRLDYDTEGLLLMTNDGELTYKITHPKNNIEKTYLAEVTGNINMETLVRLRNGVVIDGVRTNSAKVEVVGATQLGTKLSITIHEGKNRQVRRMFEAVGCIVKKLKRTNEAGLTLGHVPLGRWRKLSESEINMLKKIGTDKKSSKETSAAIYGKTTARKNSTTSSGQRAKKTQYSGNGIKKTNNKSSRTNQSGGHTQSRTNQSGGHTQSRTNQSGGRTQSKTNQSGSHTQSRTIQSGGHTQSRTNLSGGRTQSKTNQSGSHTQSKTNQSGGRTQSRTNQSGGRTQSKTNRNGSGRPQSSNNKNRGASSRNRRP